MTKTLYYLNNHDREPYAEVEVIEKPNSYKTITHHFPKGMCRGKIMKSEIGEVIKQPNSGWHVYAWYAEIWFDDKSKLPEMAEKLYAYTIERKDRLVSSCEEIADKAQQILSPYLNNDTPEFP